jgi:hypothetical protein
MLALAADGTYASYSTYADRTYLARTSQMSAYAELPCTPVHTRQDP